MKEGSVAPKERVNITYKPAIGDAKEEVELPLKLLMLGDYTMRQDPRPLEDRKPLNVDKDNFSKVMSEQKLNLNFNVKNALSENPDDELSVNLKFRRLADMEAHRRPAARGGGRAWTRARGGGAAAGGRRG